MKEKLIKRLKEVPLYATDGMQIREVLVTVFVPFTAWKWHIVESQQQDDDLLLFAYCESGLGLECSEWGYVMLSDLFAIPNVVFVIRRNIQIKSNGELLK